MSVKYIFIIKSDKYNYKIKRNAKGKYNSL